MSFWKDVSELRAAIKANVQNGKGTKSLVEAVEGQRKSASDRPAEQIQRHTDEALRPSEGGNEPTRPMIKQGASSQRRQWTGQAALWALEGLLIAVGIRDLFDQDRWPNERAHGALLIACGVVFLPPILGKIRSRAIWARHQFVPALFWFALVFLSMPLTDLLKPSLSQQRSLKVAAESEANGLVAAGQLEAARKSLARYEPERSTDPQLAALFAKIDAAPSAPAATSVVQPTTSPTISERPQSAEANFAERAETYWIPQTRAISTREPDDLDSYHARLRDLDVQAEFLHDGFALNLDRKQRAIRNTFASALAAKQSKLFPVLRRAYGKIADGRLFRQDIRVVVVGPRADTIRLTGGIFVRNANIADIQEGLLSELKAARFRRVEYRWSKYFNETTSYKLDTPSDAAVGTTTTSGEFEKLGN